MGVDKGAVVVQGSGYDLPSMWSQLHRDGERVLPFYVRAIYVQSVSGVAVWRRLAETDWA